MRSRFCTQGFILKEQTIKEKDKLVTVLTRSHGVLRCFVRGAKLLTNSSRGAVSHMCYSELTIYAGTNSYVIDEARGLRVFFDEKCSIEKLSLAQYMCELAMISAPEGAPADEPLNLLLNSMYVLTEDLKPPELIKPVFEMRLAADTGYCPDLLCCKGCGCYEAPKMFFDTENGALWCESCFCGRPHCMALSSDAVHAMRHSVYSEPKKVFAFSLTGDSLLQFSECAERYITARTERRLPTLEFYHMVSSPVFTEQTIAEEQKNGQTS